MKRLIDADALISSVLKKAIDDAFLNGNTDMHRLLIQVIAHQPTIDAEPVRHGKFIGTEYDGYADGNPVYYEWKCSECGCVFEEEEPTYRYCPYCGARMGEE